MKKQKTQYICGIDEVGRGPVAGPVTVGLFIYDRKYEEMFQEIPLLDSKKLSAKKRQAIVDHLNIWKKEGKVFFTTGSVSAHEIDGIGIAVAIRKCITKVFAKLENHESGRYKNPENISVVLDGGLYAPERFVDQQTIIKGDTKERSIAFASIVAKVIRDTYMEMQGEIYPEYGFGKHKGYGTKDHYTAMEKHGISELHRKTFLKRLID